MSLDDSFFADFVPILETAPTPIEEDAAEVDYPPASTRLNVASFRFEDDEDLEKSGNKDEEGDPKEPSTQDTLRNGLTQDTLRSGLGDDRVEMEESAEIAKEESVADILDTSASADRDDMVDNEKDNAETNASSPMNKVKIEPVDSTQQQPFPDGNGTITVESDSSILSEALSPSRWNLAKNQQSTQAETTPKKTHKTRKRIAAKKPTIPEITLDDSSGSEMNTSFNERADKIMARKLLIFMNKNSLTVPAAKRAMVLVERKVAAKEARKDGSGSEGDSVSDDDDVPADMAPPSPYRSRARGRRSKDVRSSCDCMIGEPPSADTFHGFLRISTLDSREDLEDLEKGQLMLVVHENKWRFATHKATLKDSTNPRCTLVKHDELVTMAEEKDVTTKFGEHSWQYYCQPGRNKERKKNYGKKSYTITCDNICDHVLIVDFV